MPNGDQLSEIKEDSSMCSWLNVHFFQFCGPCHDKKSEQVGNSASNQPQGYTFILIAIHHQCYNNVKSDCHTTKIGVATNELINHFLGSAQRANSSTCKVLSNKVLNNNALSFDNFVDQSSSTFQLVVASVNWI